MKIAKHVKLKIKFSSKEGRNDFFLSSAFILFLLIVFRIYRDNFANSLMLRLKIHSPTLFNGITLLLLFLFGLLETSRQLNNELPNEAHDFYKLIGFRSYDFFFLEISIMFFRSIAIAYFILTCISTCGFTWVKFITYIVILLSLWCMSAFLYYLKNACIQMHRKNTKAIKNRNRFFFKNRFLAFFYRDIHAALHSSDIWMGIWLIFFCEWFFLHYRINYYVSAYLIMWLFMLIIPDCYLYDIKNYLLFQVLHIRRKDFMRYKLIDLFCPAEMIVILYTLACIVTNQAHILYASLFFLLLTLYGFLLFLEFNLVCIYAYPSRLSFGKAVSYSFLFLVPVVPLFILIPLLKKSNKQFELPL